MTLATDDSSTIQLLPGQASLMKFRSCLALSIQVGVAFHGCVRTIAVRGDLAEVEELLADLAIEGPCWFAFTVRGSRPPAPLRLAEKTFWVLKRVWPGSRRRFENPSWPKLPQLPRS